MLIIKLVLDGVRLNQEKRGLLYLWPNNAGSDGGEIPKLRYYVAQKSKLARVDTNWTVNIQSTAGSSIIL